MRCLPSAICNLQSTARTSRPQQVRIPDRLGLHHPSPAPADTRPAIDFLPTHQTVLRHRCTAPRRPRSSPDLASAAAPSTSIPKTPHTPDSTHAPDAHTSHVSSPRRRKRRCRAASRYSVAGHPSSRPSTAPSVHTSKLPLPLQQNRLASVRPCALRSPARLHWLTCLLRFRLPFGNQTSPPQDALSATAIDFSERCLLFQRASGLLVHPFQLVLIDNTHQSFATTTSRASQPSAQPPFPNSLRVTAGQHTYCLNQSVSLARHAPSSPLRLSHLHMLTSAEANSVT